MITKLQLINIIIIIKYEIKLVPVPEIQDKGFWKERNLRNGHSQLPYQVDASS